MPVLLALVAAVAGLHGVVVRGPTMPVCRAGVPCSKPAAGVVLVFSRGDHAAARVRTDAKGRYSVRLAPGYYAVSISPRPRVGAGLKPREAHVVAGVFARLDFFVDTGIR